MRRLVIVFTVLIIVLSVAASVAGRLFERGLIADWNTCDWFCARVLGRTIAASGRVCASALARWSTPQELWKTRASVVGVVPVIAVPDHYPLVLRSSAVLIRRDERFAQTAVGWILRDFSKYDSGNVAGVRGREPPVLLHGKHS